MAYYYGVIGSYNALEIVIVCVGLAYISFLVEGIVLASTKIEQYDQEVVVREMTRRQEKGRNILASLLYVGTHGQGILVGQPLVAIVITLGFDEFFSKSEVPMLVLQQHNSHFIIAYILGSEKVRLVVSALLIYWFAQLLPQDLGKNADVEFMEIFGANTVARVLVTISRTGVGEPSFWLKSVLIALGFPKEGTNISIGRAKAFEFACEDEECFVEARHITVLQLPDNVGKIIDKSAYKYQEKTENFVNILHTYKVRTSQLKGPIVYDIELPPNFIHEKQKIAIYSSEISKYMDKVSNPVLTEEIIVRQSSSTHAPAYAKTIAEYQVGKIVLDEPNILTFSIGEPTRSLTIDVLDFDGIFTHRPIIELADDQSRIFENATLIQVDKQFVRNLTDNGWTVTLEFLRADCELLIAIDARERA